MKYFSTKLILAIIFAIALILRFYDLGKTPPSLMIDEVSNGYNAYSILITAKDEYGNFLPLTFRSFGDYNPALSVYTLIPSIAVFGLNEFAVRFPSALFGTITIITTFFLAKKITKNNTIALLSTFFLSIAPWHLQFSRYDHEANFMLTFSLLGITLVLHSFERPKLLILSALSFGLALNTYHGAKIWIPIITASLTFFYFKELLKMKKEYLLSILIFAIFTLPILLNIGDGLIRGKSVGIVNSNKPIETFVSGYLNHFSPTFLFISGDPIGRHSVSGMGQLYIFEIFLLIPGSIILLKQKSKHYKFLLTWLLLAPIPAAFATPTPHSLRAITFLPLFSIISAIGLDKIINSKPKLLTKVLLVAIVVIGLYNFLTYVHLYYRHEPKLKAVDWFTGYKEMVTYVAENQNKYESVAITDYYVKPYIFLLFYSKYDPAKYQKHAENKKMFDKYEFFGQEWGNKTSTKALVVTPFWQAHPKTVLTEIYSKNGDIVFIISESE